MWVFRFRVFISFGLDRWPAVQSREGDREAPRPPRALSLGCLQTPPLLLELWPVLRPRPLLPPLARSPGPRTAVLPQGPPPAPSGPQGDGSVPRRRTQRPPPGARRGPVRRPAEPWLRNTPSSP